MTTMGLFTKSEVITVRAFTDQVGHRTERCVCVCVLCVFCKTVYVFVVGNVVLSSANIFVCMSGCYSPSQVPVQVQGGLLYFGSMVLQFSPSNIAYTTPPSTPPPPPPQPLPM
jgi:hypothetical protein